MNNSEQWVALDHAADFFSGGTPSKANADYWNGAIPWVSAKDMKSPKIVDTEDHISGDGLANGSRLAPAGATLVLVRGMTLLNDVPMCISIREVAFNQDIKALVPKFGVNSAYLNYALRASKPQLLAAVDLAGHGTGKLPTDILKSIRIRLPIEQEQQIIAHILGTLDDKIELNRRMNETLEAIARAIFQSWFVDFDPVRAKASGERADSICQRLGLTPELLELFPDSFEDSELGEIPTGWQPTRLDDVLELAYGKALKAIDRIDGEIPVYGSGGVTGYHNESLINGPTIIVGRKGTVGSLYWEDRSSYPIDTVFYVMPKLELTYCFYLLRTLALETMNTDAAVPGLNRNNVYRLLTSLPDEKVRAAFDDVAMSVRRQMRANTDELQTLSEVRDALLPKLLSGELIVRWSDFK